MLIKSWVFLVICIIGVNKDSQYRLKETDKCIEWIIKTFKEEKVDYVVFCGDFFDSRFSINVQTLNCAIQAIQNLAYNFERLYLIVGNHDTYYKNVNTVNSIKFLEKISQTDNIIIIQDDPYFLMIQDKRLGFFPWGYTPEQRLNIKNYEICDYGFGHFETNGIEQTGSISSGAKYNYSELFNLGEKIFSGHYHTNTFYSNKKLLMIGSTLQLDWSDFNKKKYIYTLDPVNDILTPFENNINARFEKIYYSKFEKNGYTENDLIKLCKHNFIKFVIDVKYQFNDILKFTEIIKEYKPASLEIEYLISLTSDIILESTDDIVKSNSKDNKIYLLEYVQKVYNEIKNVDSSIDLNFLQELIHNYYQKSLLTDAERQEKELTQNKVMINEY